MNAIRVVLSLFLLLASAIQAGTRSQDEAMVLAMQFRKNLSTSPLRSAVTLQEVELDQQGFQTIHTETPAFYLFNVGENQGFVLVSGQQGTKTILGYSDQGHLQSSCMPDNLKAWLQSYEQEIESFRSTARDPGQRLQTPVYLPTPVVPPLLDKNNWQQLEPFNQYCPWDSVHAGRSSVGCVALAMGQVMRYHQWPNKPIGSYPIFQMGPGVKYQVFDTLSYDWNAMPTSTDNSTSEQNYAQIARLLYHCGLSAQMQYSSQGSGTDVSLVGSAMLRNFNYDADIQHYKREHFKTEAWNALLMKELDEARPVIYAAFKGDAGHVFVCDGYDSNKMYHINWGWGGNGNGYFELSSLNPEAPGVTDAPQGFSMDQSMIVNIRKPDQISQTTYSIGMSGGNIVATSAVFSKTDRFFVRYNCKNFGTNSFEGRLGLAYYDKNNQLKPMDKTLTANMTFLSGYVKSYFYDNLTLPTEMGHGLYQVCAIYRPKDSLNWSVIPGVNGIQLQVSDNVAKFFYGNSSAILELKTPIIVQRKLYQNRMFETNMTCKNYDITFPASLSLVLCAMDGTPLKKLCQQKMTLQSGQIQMLTFRGQMSCPPGKYRLQVNANSPYLEYNFTILGPTSCNNLPIDVLPEPGPPILQLMYTMQLSCNPTFDRKDSLALKVKVINTGGIWDGNIAAMIYPLGSGDCVGTLGSKEVWLDSMETKTLTFNEKLTLAAGNYTMSLCQWVDSITQPIELAKHTFTVQNIENPKIDPLSWFLSDGKLVLSGESDVERITLYSLYGVQYANETSRPYIQVSNLPKGAYILKVRMKGTVYTSRFFKD